MKPKLDLYPVGADQEGDVRISNINEATTVVTFTRKQ